MSPDPEPRDAGRLRHHMVRKAARLYLTAGLFLVLLACVVGVVGGSPALPPLQLGGTAAFVLLGLMTSLIGILFVATLSIAVNRPEDPQVDAAVPVVASLIDGVALGAAIVGLLQLATADPPDTVSAASVLRLATSALVVCIATVATSVIPQAVLRDHEATARRARRERVERSVRRLTSPPPAPRATAGWLAAQTVLPIGVALVGLAATSADHLARTLVALVGVFAFGGVLSLTALAAVIRGAELLSLAAVGALLNLFLAGFIAPLATADDRAGLVVVSGTYVLALLTWAAVVVRGLLRAPHGLRWGLLWVLTIEHVRRHPRTSSVGRPRRGRLGRLVDDARALLGHEPPRQR